MIHVALYGLHNQWSTLDGLTSLSQSDAWYITISCGT